MTAAAQLDDIDRSHDDAPEQAAARLAALDHAQVPADKLPLLGFLLNHVLGEKLGRWQVSASYLAPLAERDDAPLGIARHWAAAADLAGDAAAFARARAQLVERSGAPAHVCAVLARLSTLNWIADAALHAVEFAQLAQQAIGFDRSGVDAGFAATFNNITSRLLVASPPAPVEAPLRGALNHGAEAARVFWYRAGQWLERERADYLCAKVALRIGDPGRACVAARHGLALVAANGNDPVERAFLLQPLAAALARAGDAAAAHAVRAEADALAATFDTGLRNYYTMDTDELFGAAS
jgi:hypothetical protein